MARSIVTQSMFLWGVSGEGRVVPEVLELVLCRRVGGVGEVGGLDTGGKTPGVQTDAKDADAFESI